MTLNNSMSITPMPPAVGQEGRFEHGSVLGGKTRGARVSSQWKSTLCVSRQSGVPTSGRQGRMMGFDIAEVVVHECCPFRAAASRQLDRVTCTCKRRQR